MFSILRLVLAAAMSLVLLFVVANVAAEQAVIVPGDYVAVFNQAPGVSALGAHPRNSSSYAAAAAYIQQLKAERPARMAEMEALAPGISGRIISQYFKVLNGLAFHGTDEEVAALMALPFISHIEPVHVASLSLDHSVPMTGAPLITWHSRPLRGMVCVSVS